MARVAMCPQCSHELLLADDMEMSTWAKCPECRAFFQIKDASVRDVPMALMVDDESLAARDALKAADETARIPLENEPAGTRRTFSESSAQTVSDFGLSASGGEMPRETFATREVGIDEPVTPSMAEADDGSGRVPPTIMDLSSLARPDYAPLDESVAPSIGGQEEIARAQTTLIETMPAEIAPPPPPAANRADDSSDRIDKWFRSAKTLAESPAESTNVPDLFAVPSGDVAANASGTSPASSVAETDSPPPSAPVLAGASSQSETEAKSAVSNARSATWEDQDRMERLLADVQKPSANTSASEQDEPRISGSSDQSTANAWSTEISPTLSLGSGRKPRRKKSALRSIATTVVAGLVGIGLGYYALFWIAGPSADFLDAAQYLPAAMLPDEFQSSARQFAAGTPPSQRAGDNMERPEVQTSFDEPVSRLDEQLAAERADTSPDATNLRTDPPAAFESAGAMPLAGNSLPSASATVADAPSFTADELAVALRAAREAQPGLVAGDLSDGREVQRAKGFSYSLLCDLAQKVAFVDRSSRADYRGPLERDAEVLFRQTLADEHTRDEVARIVPKWLVSPNRKHGGIFFAGTVLSGVDKGSVVECGIELSSGNSLTLLVPSEHADRLGDSAIGPVGIVGWIVEQPAAQVSGYTGSAPQAIWVSKVVTLEQ